MSRLIDADALWMDVIHSMDYCDDILEFIERQPTIEPEPYDEEANYWHEKANSYEQTLVKLAQSIAEQPERKKGRWIPQEAENGDPYGDKCSECGEWYVMPEGKTNYCPNWGAWMEGER